MTPRIDYARIGRAVTFYRMNGYRYLEVPWIAEPASTNVTLPPGARATQAWEATTFGDIPLGDLVGSAEQSFIQLLRDGQLTAGKYVAVTPCFRREPEYNDRYQPYFMKVELIQVLDGTERREDMGVPVYTMAEQAFDFFRSELHRDDEGYLQFDEMAFESTDIALAGIEVGSYGYREWEGHRWIYGTGLAEPRFSVARKAAVPATIAAL